jgi:hypothetical protein
MFKDKGAFSLVVVKELHGDVSLADSSEEDSESESEDEDAELLTDKVRALL